MIGTLSFSFLNMLHMTPHIISFSLANKHVYMLKKDLYYRVYMSMYVPI